MHAERANVAIGSGDARARPNHAKPQNRAAALAHLVSWSCRCCMDVRVPCPALPPVTSFETSLSAPTRASALDQDV